ncbi:MAG: ImmA/IrrE family metallo-endopeptidase [Phycisphaerae bacterium]|nr:ImmA/IrrE family metallo-endopeptidase [Phycisphaerae bacterium]
MTTVAQRLREARIAAGMTQDEVIAALDRVGATLTKAGLSKYERGGSVPKAPMLRSLARVLDVRTDYFFHEPQFTVTWLAFRKVATLGKKRQERVKLEAAKKVEVILTLVQALHAETDSATESVEPTRVKDADDVETAAEQLRRAWRLGEQPIDSVTDTIETHGGIVAEADDGETPDFDGLSGWANDRVPVTVVSKQTPDDRRRFSLAHELGHLFMECGGIDAKTEERWAHRFAAAFLVPRRVVHQELGERRRRLNFNELAILKLKHGLSMQAWIYRAHDLGIIDDRHKRTLFTDFSARGWRRDEPVQYEGREQPQRLKQLAARAFAEGVITQERAEQLCPGVTQELTETTSATAESLDPRNLRKLPRADRDRLLKQAAELIHDEYRGQGDLSGMEFLAEEDHHDEQPPD